MTLIQPSCEPSHSSLNNYSDWQLSYLIKKKQTPHTNKRKKKIYVFIFKKCLNIISDEKCQLQIQNKSNLADVITAQNSFVVYSILL